MLGCLHPCGVRRLSLWRSGPARQPLVPAILAACLPWWFGGPLKLCWWACWLWPCGRRLLGLLGLRLSLRAAECRQPRVQRRPGLLHRVGQLGPHPGKGASWSVQACGRFACGCCCFVGRCLGLGLGSFPLSQLLLVPLPAQEQQGSESGAGSSASRVSCGSPTPVLRGGTAAPRGR